MELRLKYMAVDLAKEPGVWWHAMICIIDAIFSLYCKRNDLHMCGPLPIPAQQNQLFETMLNLKVCGIDLPVDFQTSV